MTHVKQTLTVATAAAVLGGSALAGAGTASADKPDPWDPWRPGHSEWAPGHGKQWDDWGDRDWYRWYDHQPPWGWGPPPQAAWRGVLPPPWGVPPPPFNYWGFTVFPVWDPGYNAWGFWLFGLFIPLVAIG